MARWEVIGSRTVTSAIESTARRAMSVGNIAFRARRLRKLEIFAQVGDYGRRIAPSVSRAFRTPPRASTRNNDRDIARVENRSAERDEKSRPRERELRLLESTVNRIDTSPHPRLIISRVVAYPTACVPATKQRDPSRYNERVHVLADNQSRHLPRWKRTTPCVTAKARRGLIAAR